jgi:predicted DNA binding protein
MVFIAGQFSADEILCNVPPHTLRIDLQARRWKSDVDPDSAIVDKNDNGIPIEFILLGFTPYFGNLGLRNQEEFLRIAYIGVSPNHRLLPPRCVTTSMISGKSSQKNFISYFQTLYNNRINCASVVTATKFVTRSFNERDPITGADGAKINFNALEFADRPAASDDETKLIEDVNAWLSSTGTNLITAALKSHIPGSDLVELPLGSDHAEIKAQFAATRGAPVERSLPSAGVPAKALKAADVADDEESNPPPAPKAKKALELTEEQAKALGLEF